MTSSLHTHVPSDASHSVHLDQVAPMCTQCAGGRSADGSQTSVAGGRATFFRSNRRSCHKILQLTVGRQASVVPAILLFYPHTPTHTKMRSPSSPWTRTNSLRERATFCYVASTPVLSMTICIDRPFERGRVSLSIERSKSGPRLAAITMRQTDQQRGGYNGII